MTKPIERMNTAMRTLGRRSECKNCLRQEDGLGQMSLNFNIMANGWTQSVQDKVEKQEGTECLPCAMMQAH